MVDAAGTEAALRNLEAAALAEQQVFLRHAHIGEDHFGGAVGHAVEAEDRQRTLDLDAGRVHRHEDHRLLLVAVRIARIALAHEDADLAARVGGVGRVPLVAVDDVVVAIAHDRALDIGRVGGGHRRLGHGETGADFARQQRLQPFLLVGFRAVALQHLHIAGVGRVTIEDLGRQMRAAHDFAERGVFEIGEAGAAVAVGQEEVPETLRLGERLQLLDDGINLPGPEFFHFAIVAGFVRVDVVVHEAFELALDFEDALGGRIEHGHSLSFDCYQLSNEIVVQLFDRACQPSCFGRNCNIITFHPTRGEFPHDRSRPSPPPPPPRPRSCSSYAWS